MDGLIKSGSLSITERLTGCDMPKVELFKYKFNMFFFSFFFHFLSLISKPLASEYSYNSLFQGDLELGRSDFWQMPEVWGLRLGLRRPGKVLPHQTQIIQLND